MASAWEAEEKTKQCDCGVTSALLGIRFAYQFLICFLVSGASLSC
jgi:hypothetical protein